jgi:hypothetical protein
MQVWVAVQQAVPHGVRVPQPAELHALLTQTSPPLQLFTQLPQWVASDGTQALLQSSRPDGHEHWLF